MAFLGVFHTKSALTIFTNVVGKAADARTYTYFLNLINKIQRLTQASQRRQKWRFFLPFLQKDGEFRNSRSFLNGFCTYNANKLLEKAATALPIEGGY